MDYFDPINRAIDHIEESLTQEIDLSEVAAAAGYSLFHLSRLFVAMTGETPVGYIRKRRLSEAARQLLTSKRRILDIALDCQFGSQAAFTRAFRATFGISPGAYRKRGRPTRLTRRMTLCPPKVCRLHATLVLPAQRLSQAAHARLLCPMPRRGPARDPAYLLFL
jgi:AraC family transcriptional regulator